MQGRSRRLAHGAGIALALLVGCAGGRSDATPAWLTRLAAAPKPPARNENWPLPPARMEQLLRTGDFELRKHEATASGITGAMRLTVRFESLRRDVDLKWKVAPQRDAEGWNNSPRREIASYQIQKWFLEPSAYVVPTTVARCLPLDVYRRIDPAAEPNLPGTRCVFGVASVWLEKVEVPEVLFDEARFESDPIYARHFANFNILNYLIENRDGRADNVLASTNESNRRVFAVDNGIAFGERIYNFFVRGWEDIRVGALPRDSIARLRKLTREDAEALAVVAEFRLGRDGVLREVKPGPPLDPASGSTYRDGVLQLGLEEDEIDEVWERVEELLATVAEEKLRVF
jgi:hypothetical protein